MQCTESMCSVHADDDHTQSEYSIYFLSNQLYWVECSSLCVSSDSHAFRIQCRGTMEQRTVTLTTLILHSPSRSSRAIFLFIFFIFSHFRSSFIVVESPNKTKRITLKLCENAFSSVFSCLYALWAPTDGFGKYRYEYIWNEHRTYSIRVPVPVSQHTAPHSAHCTYIPIEKESLLLLSLVYFFANWTHKVRSQFAWNRHNAEREL